MSFTDALFPNNTAILARNNAGTGTVEVLKVNTADAVVYNGAIHNFDDDVFKISDEADSTKSLVVSLGGATTAKTMTLASSHTDDRVVTLPDATTTLMGADTVDILSNKTFTLPQINDTSLDHQYVFAVSELVADRIVTLPLLNSADEFVFKDHAVTLTNKTITSAANTLTIDADVSAISNIKNAEIKAAAAIALNKLAAATASRALVSDGSGFITPATTTSTEIGYVNGVTSSIQTQINTKLPTTITTTGDIIYSSSGATANRLAAGSVGEVLTMSGGIPSWAATAAGAPTAPTSKTTTYTATSADDIILADTSAGDWTLTLYASSGNAGKRLTIKKTTGDLNALTIDGNASETLDGNTTTTLNTGNETLVIVSDGTNWEILERRIQSQWESFTPTGSWVTNTTYTGQKRRVGDTMEYKMEIATSGAPTATPLTVNLPTDEVIDTSKLPGSVSIGLGNMGLGAIHDLSGNEVAGTVQYNTTTSVRASVLIDTALSEAMNNIDATTPFTFASGDSVRLIFSVPIVGFKG